MAIQFPALDPRNEEEVVADVIDSLPVELSDRNAAATAVKLIEGMGAFYGAMLYYLNLWNDRIVINFLNLLDIGPDPALPAQTLVTFTKDAISQSVTVPAGTVVKDRIDSEAVKFRTATDLLIQPGTLSGTVGATATEVGAATNVRAGTLTRFEVPVAGIASVTNADPATGGADEEDIASMIARAPLAIRAQERAITAEDFSYHAVNVPGVERAKTLGTLGVVSTIILASDLNATANASLISAVRTELLGRATPGVSVNVSQPTIRLITFPTIQLVLEAGETVASVQPRVQQALANYITAVDIIASDGRTIEYPGWEFGAKLYRNEVISLLDRVQGVKRVGGLVVQHTDDYGSTYTNGVVLNEQSPGFNGTDNDLIGLLHLDPDIPVVIQVIS